MINVRIEVRPATADDLSAVNDIYNQYEVKAHYTFDLLPNPASIGLHQRFGFKRVGHFTEQGRKFGRFWDVAWYEEPLGSESTGAS